MNLVVLTGAGISRESGLLTFRDSDGLWAGYDIDEVCTPEALKRNPGKVLEFYNMRRHEVSLAEPNPGHLALAKLETLLPVHILTQNIDDLHERAGSTHVHHLHGEVFRSRSSQNFDLQQETRGDVHLGDLAPDGAQLRPHVCFFGEVPYGWGAAQDLAIEADIFAVIGTSLAVYPAAGLVDVTRAKHLVIVDPAPPNLTHRRAEVHVIAEAASTGVPKMADLIRQLVG